MRVPLAVDAMYITLRREPRYFKGRIDTLTYEFAP